MLTSVLMPKTLVFNVLEKFLEQDALSQACPKHWSLQASFPLLYIIMHKDMVMAMMMITNYDSSQHLAQQCDSFRQ